MRNIAILPNEQFQLFYRHFAIRYRQQAFNHSNNRWFVDLDQTSILEEMASNLTNLMHLLGTPAKKDKKIMVVEHLQKHHFLHHLSTSHLLYRESPSVLGNEGYPSFIGLDNLVRDKMKMTVTDLFGQVMRDFHINDNHLLTRMPGSWRACVVLPPASYGIKTDTTKQRYRPVRNYFEIQRAMSKAVSESLEVTFDGYSDRYQSQSHLITQLINELNLPLEEYSELNQLKDWMNKLVLSSLETNYHSLRHCNGLDEDKQRYTWHLDWMARCSDFILLAQLASEDLGTDPDVIRHNRKIATGNAKNALTKQDVFTAVMWIHTYTKLFPH